MKNSVRKIVESAVLIGLAVAIDLVFEIIPFLNMPAGGHISLAMLPIMIIGFRNGWVYGIVSGIVYGFLNFLLDGYGLHWGSLFLDYLIAFGALGITGFFRKKSTNVGVMLMVMALACFIRYISTSLSGVLFFRDEDASLGAAFVYSFVTYNLPYLGVSTLLCLIVGDILQLRGLIFWKTDLDPRTQLAPLAEEEVETLEEQEEVKEETVEEVKAEEVKETETEEK